MRVRVPELFDERGLTTYQVLQLAQGRISTTALYRLVRAKGRVQKLNAKMLTVLCDVLQVEPNELLEPDPPKRKRG